jgi:hypothetical protein
LLIFFKTYNLYMWFKNLVKISLIVSAVLFPFWITSIIFIFAIFYFEDFYFGLLVMFLTDLLYRFETIYLMDIPGILFFGAVSIFVISSFIKKFVNINK